MPPGRLHAPTGAWRGGRLPSLVGMLYYTLSRRIMVRRRRSLLVALLWIAGILVAQHVASRTINRHSRAAKEEEEQRRSADHLRTAQAHIGALEAAGGGQRGGAARAALARAYAGDTVGAAGPLPAAARALLRGLRGHEGYVPCPPELELHGGVGGNSSAKLFFAANVHNNEKLMPHYITELAGTLAMFPPQDVFVSIYESGSTDSTVAWLGVLARVVAALGCPHVIVTFAGEHRGKDQDRIEYLAGVRNKAMQPLFEAAAAAGAGGAAAREGPADRLLRESREEDGSSAGAASEERPVVISSAGEVPHVHKVVFLNDVHFCAQHIARLVAHEDVDLTCGMDFDHPGLKEQEKRVKQKFMAESIRKWVGGKRVAKLLSRWTWLRKKWVKQKHAEERWLEESVPGFYDVWVAHDVGGHMFSKHAPYLEHAYSRDRLAQGLPFPVHCCWNGIAVINAAPFWEHGLRFRMHHEGECAASECSLICADLARLGFGRAVVDPSVRLGYDPETQRMLYNAGRVEGIPLVPWGEARRAAPIDWGYVPEKTYVLCCPMPEGGTQVEFDDLSNPWAVTGRKFCYQEDIWTPLPHTRLPRLPTKT